MKFYTKASRSADVTQRELDNLAIAYEAACESMVLLKNEGCLPFKANKIALYGAGAERTIKGGTGSGEVNERHSVSIAEGLRDRGIEITTEGWLEGYEQFYAAAFEENRKNKWKEINITKPDTWMGIVLSSFRAPAGQPITAEDVEKSDTDSCIYVVSRQAGEGGDRRAVPGDLFLTEGEIAAIRTCAENYDHFLLVINAGSSIDMGFLQEIEGIDAVLYLCQLGTEGGHAFADVVTGKVCPSGKLSDTWAKQYADIPFSQEYSYLNGNLEDEYYKEGIYVGYRYFDSLGVEPAFPFGFGLSYTNFDMHSAGVTMDGSRVQVQATVRNAGIEFAGKEVVQLYVSAPEGKLHKEYQSLAAFSKTQLLAPGEKQTLTLSFDLADVASYREEDAAFVLEKGEYILRLGNSSRSTVTVGAVVVDEEVIVSRHDHICPAREAIDALESPAREAEVLHPGLPRLTLAEGAIEPLVYTYEKPALYPDDPRVKAFVEKLTLQEMVDIVVGIGMFGGEKKFHLPGSVGNTTSKFWEKGLANVALCDGPAGLRIQQKSVIDEKGRLKGAALALSTFDNLPKFIRHFLAGNTAKGTPLYQFATAFPVENALAQSWNTKLLEKVGTAIFREMQEYGCTYWLAPAMNIHRNPLCGRNFEYFSEDPFLTGAMAAAITRGVQQEPGYYVTIKHFACNNQEDNRMHVSSNLSERALREIYLRGFKMAVRSGAKSVMTSYNRLNGVYTPNSYDLCTKVLRNEWGFDGVVMTDWFSTSKGQGNNAMAMAAGNDLIMPGGGHFKKEIIRGVQSGKIQKEDVIRCCANVVKSIFDSATQREYIG